MTAPVPPPLDLRPCGSRAVLVEVADGAAARSLAAYVREQGLPVTDVVTGAATVLLDGLGPELVSDPAALRRRLAAWVPSTDDRASAGVVEVAVVYDGADLADIAARWGTDVAGVVARHGELTFTSAFCGFAPGFAYLEGLPAELAVPRLDSPRTRVPAGSVALAGSWCGVYPSASPGGWRLLGHTTAILWDPERVEPALLAPGTRVRFVPA